MQSFSAPLSRAPSLVAGHPFLPIETSFGKAKNSKLAMFIAAAQAQEEARNEALKIEKGKVRILPASQPEPFLPVYEKLFSQENIRVLYVELDPGVDDAAALVQLVAASRGDSNPVISKKVIIEGVVPCVGNAILSQTEVNARQLLELTNSRNVQVYPGAVAPLAIENNTQAIEEMAKGINATHFYGHNGLSDVDGMPKVNMPMQVQRGYQFAADRIAHASPENPITLISTSALTELSKTLEALIARDAEMGFAPGSFAKNIKAISIMGGCIDQKAGCNAPFNVPDSQKNSEANFYFDSDAAKKVFEICYTYNIPILLAPLDLTQQPGLLWGPEQTERLRSLNNPVASQMAKVFAVVPYLDAPCFPNGTYPMHDLFATVPILRPDMLAFTRMAAKIGDVGQIIEDKLAPLEKRNVFVMSMPKQNQSHFYEPYLSQYERFNNGSSLSTILGTTISAAGAAILGLGGGLICCRKRCKKNTGPTEQDTLLN